jgi:hypothetical protein
MSRRLPKTAESDPGRVYFREVADLIGRQVGYLACGPDCDGQRHKEVGGEPRKGDVEPTRRWLRNPAILRAFSDLRTT